jgi:hypothetical protein
LGRKLWVSDERPVWFALMALALSRRDEMVLERMNMMNSRPVGGDVK